MEELVLPMQVWCQLVWMVIFLAALTAICFAIKYLTDRVRQRLETRQRIIRANTINDFVNWLENGFDQEFYQEVERYQRKKGQDPWG